MESAFGLLKGRWRILLQLQEGFIENTLRRLVGGEVSMGARPGPQSVLGNDLEARLEHYIISMSEVTVRPGVVKIRTMYVFVFAPKEVQCP